MDETNERAEKPKARVSIVIGTLIAIAIVGAIAFVVYGRLSAPQKPASNPRWENYLKEHAAQSASGQSAYEQHQALLAEKRRKAAEKAAK
jgi:hypothetical protein